MRGGSARDRRCRTAGASLLRRRCGGRGVSIGTCCCAAAVETSARAGCPTSAGFEGPTDLRMAFSQTPSRWAIVEHLSSGFAKIAAIGARKSRLNHLSFHLSFSSWPTRTPSWEDSTTLCLRCPTQKGNGQTRAENRSGLDRSPVAPFAVIETLAGTTLLEV